VLIIFRADLLLWSPSSRINGAGIPAFLSRPTAARRGYSRVLHGWSSWALYCSVAPSCPCTKARRQGSRSRIAYHVLQRARQLDPPLLDFLVDPVSRRLYRHCPSVRFFGRMTDLFPPETSLQAFPISRLRPIPSYALLQLFLPVAPWRVYARRADSVSIFSTTHGYGTSAQPEAANDHGEMFVLSPSCASACVPASVTYLIRHLDPC